MGAVAVGAAAAAVGGVVFLAAGVRGSVRRAGRSGQADLPCYATRAGARVEEVPARK